MIDPDNKDDKSGSKPDESVTPTRKLSPVEEHKQWLIDHGFKIRKLEPGEAIVWFPKIRQPLGTWMASHPTLLNQHGTSLVGC